MCISDCDKVLCVTRGGVFVGGLLAHFLDLRNITTIALMLYDGHSAGETVKEVSSPDLPPPGSRILLVDDLLDSGRTLAYVVSKWGKQYAIDVAVLYDKGGGDFRPTFAAKDMPNEWVHFPWERNAALKPGCGE